MARVVVLILHRRAEPDAGPLSNALAMIRWRNAERHAEGFRALAADVQVDDATTDRSFGARLRDAAGARGGDAPAGIVVLGSGSIPLATQADRRGFVGAAEGPPGRALANNRFSADIVAVADGSALRDLPDVRSDNALPRWLAETAGVVVDDLHRRWRLQVDLDAVLDGLLVRPSESARILARLASDVTLGPVRAAVAGAAAAARSARCEVIVAGRSSADSLAWLERSTASRTRALIEERGFRTRPAGQRPVRSVLGQLLDRDGPSALGPRLAELGDAALVDSRVLLAHRFGADEAGWPSLEDRLASDLLLPERVDDSWLRALTASARDAAIPIVLGGHTLVGPGLRLAIRRGNAWT